MKNESLVEMDQTQMEMISKENLEIIDSFLSKSTQEFDIHRIFKVPHSIDLSTGQIVAENSQRIELNDRLDQL